MDVVPAWGVLRARSVTPLRRRRRDNEQGRKRRSVAVADDDRQEYRVVTSCCRQDLLNATTPSSSSLRQVESYPTKPPYAFMVVRELIFNDNALVLLQFDSAVKPVRTLSDSLAPTLKLVCELD